VTATPNDTTAIVLMTYGTPDGPDAVEPYLFNIFNDPDIIELPWYMAPFRGALATKISKGRSEEVRHNYGRLPGGRSPLNELTAEQGQALVRALEPHGRFESFLGMRYWAPRIDDALRPAHRSTTSAARRRSSGCSIAWRCAPSARFPRTPA
jgi:ferrochelatase